MTIQTIRNMGPAMEAAFAKAGLTSADELRALGADAAYARLLATGHRAHFMAYLALVSGLRGHAIATIGPDEKAQLRMRFDGLRQAVGPDRRGGAGIEAELERLGLGGAPRSGRARR